MAIFSLLAVAIVPAIAQVECCPPNGIVYFCVSVLSILTMLLYNYQRVAQVAGFVQISDNLYKPNCLL